MAGKAKKKPPKLVVAQTRAQPADGKAVKTTSKSSKHKHKHAGRHEKSDDAVLTMRKQLTAIGCKLLEVEADGNCLFRSLGDQLFGDQHQHAEIRKRIVDFIELQREAFEPFMEDEEKFEHYCKRMREDGTWGGNQELYAAARVFQVYIVLHQESARMVIECDALKPTRVLHVAYHGSDHYDSVRALQDPTNSAHDAQPPLEIALDCDGFRPEDLAKRWRVQHAHQRIAAAADMHEQGGENDDDAQARRLVHAVETLQLDASDPAGSRTRSKKEQRQLRKAIRSSNAAKSARSIVST